MTTVASKQLGFNAAVPTTGSTLYTVPTGKRTIVKSIVLHNNGGAAARANIAVLSGASTLFNYFVDLAASGAAGDSKTDAPWLVMEAGESLKLFASVGTIQAYASGAELTL